MRERLHTLVAFSAMLAVLATCGWLLGGPDGALIAAAVPLVAAPFAPRLSPQTLMRMEGGQPITPWQAPELYAMLAELSERAGLRRVPQLYWLRGARINAGSAGDGHEAAVGISDGALRLLDPREMRGVLAHEVAHLAGGDSRTMLLTGLIRWLTETVALFGLGAGFALLVIFGTDAISGWVLWVFALAPTAVALLAMALARGREFVADRRAVEITGDPAGLASALVRIETLDRSLFRRLFAGPWRGARGGILSTHPAVEERVERLARAYGRPRLNRRSGGG